MIKSRSMKGRVFGLGGALASGLLLAACAAEPADEGEEPAETTEEVAPAEGETASAEGAGEEMAATQLPNPAATFCIDQGGRHEIRTGEDGGQVGYCILADGSEVIAWDYFREQNAPAESAEAEPGAVGLPNPAAVFCTEAGGTYESRPNEEGAAVGYCTLADGTEVNAWEYFRENAG